MPYWYSIPMPSAVEQTEAPTEPIKTNLVDLILGSTLVKGSIALAGIVVVALLGAFLTVWTGLTAYAIPIAWGLLAVFVAERAPGFALAQYIGQTGGVGQL